MLAYVLIALAAVAVVVGVYSYFIRSTKQNEPMVDSNVGIPQEQGIKGNKVMQSLDNNQIISAMNVPDADMVPNINRNQILTDPRGLTYGFNQFPTETGMNDVILAPGTEQIALNTGANANSNVIIFGLTKEMLRLQTENKILRRDVSACNGTTYEEAYGYVKVNAMPPPETIMKPMNKFTKLPGQSVSVANFWIDEKK